VRKFLIRKPIVAGDMTSPFGMRYHPILRYAALHTGVDWGAPIGTPILAAGNGVVIKAEFTSGYGRRVRSSTPTLRHTTITCRALRAASSQARASRRAR